MKKFLFVIFVIAFCIKCNSQTFSVNGIYYTITSISNATVSANLQKAYYLEEADDRTEINVPESIVYEGRKYTVNEIAGSYYNNPFTNTYNPIIRTVNKINIPNTVTKLNDRAFAYFFSIRNIDLNNVEELASDIFYGCENLNQLVIPTTVKNIYDKTFNGSNLRAIFMLSTTPPNVTETTCGYNITDYYKNEIIVPIKYKYENTYWGRLSENLLG